MTKYRIVPQSDGKYHVQYSFSGPIGRLYSRNWYTLQDWSETYWKAIEFDSIEKARKAIDEEKEAAKRREQKEREFKKWKRKNPTIYV